MGNQLLHDYDVIIVGYGPIGAALANLLGQQNVRVAIFEREADVFHQPRASHLDAEIMRVFQTVGLADTLEPKLVSTKGTHFINPAGKLLLEFERREGLGPLGWDNHYRFYQPTLEQVLREGVDRFESVDVYLSHDVTDITSDENQVKVTVENVHDQTQREFTAKYAVGCDGGRSLVRAVMGNEIEDLGLHQPWLVVDVKLKQPVDLPEQSIQFCNPARPMTYVPKIGSHDRYRWEIMLMPGDEKEEMEREETVWELIKPWVNPDNAVLERATVYTFHSVLVKQWRKGRLLLAGDAAHQMPPFMGQGLCAGVRDVSNLAWKMNMVLKQQASEELLDTYGSERSPHVRQYIKLSMELGSIITARTPEEIAEREKKTNEVLKQIAPPLGQGLHGDEPLPAGTLFPQPRMNDGRLLDEVIGAFNFAVIGDQRIIDQVSSETKQIWKDLHATIITQLCPEIEQWLDVHDVKALILRPDRYILATAQQSEQLDAQSEKLLQFLNHK